MPLTINNDTAIHEAGHCLVSYLAFDLFEIKFVTINTDISKIQDSTSLGGLKGYLKKEFKTFSFQDHDLMILMCLAGLCADDINHCEGNLNEQLYDNFVFEGKMNSKKYSGDSQLLMPHLIELVTLYNIDQRQYIISCQRLLNEIFTIDWIKTILIELRNKIANSSNQTMQGSEIISYLDNTDLKKWRENNWKKIIEARMVEFNNISQRVTKPKVKKTWLQRFFDLF